jgi:addiction module HigA family antidote
MKKYIDVTPGEILKEEFLEPMGISQYRLAKALGVSPMRISEIVNGKRAITAETGLMLDKFFGLSEGYWSGIQNNIDTALAKRKIYKALDGIQTFYFQPEVRV